MESKIGNTPRGPVRARRIERRSRGDVKYAIIKYVDEFRTEIEATDRKGKMYLKRFQSARENF